MLSIVAVSGIIKAIGEYHRLSFYDYTSKRKQFYKEEYNFLGTRDSMSTEIKIKQYKEWCDKRDKLLENPYTEDFIIKTEIESLSYIIKLYEDGK